MGHFKIMVVLQGGTWRTIQSIVPPLDPTMAGGAPKVQGIVLISILLNAYFFGLVSQQFYRYWVCRFKDRLFLKAFVVVQYLIVALQSILMWHFAYELFVLFPSFPPSKHKPDLWEGPVNSICQLIIILLANIFLALRIHTLTNSRIQSGLIAVLSIAAFIVGMITTVMTWKSTIGVSARQTTSVVWHSIQAIAECLITLFLVRALLKSRSGVRRSDTIVNYLIRSAIQTGFLATAWAIAALVTFFFLPKMAAYRIIDLTSGTVYTHAIFDTLISRVRLRERMAAPTTHGMGWTTQNGLSRSSRPHDSVSVVRVPSLLPSSSDTIQLGSNPTTNVDDIELQTLSPEKSTSRYKFSYKPHDP